MNSLEKLNKLVRDQYDRKILDLFVKRAGDKAEKKADRAMQLMEQGKSFGRALADALEK